MRSMWKGTISFGLVNVPVALYTATDEHSISFKQVHKADAGRIKHDMRCSVCGEIVPFSDIGKGHEHDDKITIIDDADLASLPVSTLKTIEVVQFSPPDQVSTLLRGKPYYVGPDGKNGNGKAYALLAGALASRDVVGVCKVTLRARETMALLRESDGLLILEMLRWADEVREAPAVPDAPVLAEQAEMAGMLVDSMIADFDPAAFTDSYTEALTAMLAVKEAGGTVAALPAEEAAPEIDLTAALTASLAAKAA